MVFYHNTNSSWYGNHTPRVTGISEHERWGAKQSSTLLCTRTPLPWPTHLLRFTIEFPNLQPSIPITTDNPSLPQENKDTEMKLWKPSASCCQPHKTLTCLAYLSIFLKPASFTRTLGGQPFGSPWEPSDTDSLLNWLSWLFFFFFFTTF